MGSALSTKGGLTVSQKKRAVVMGISNSDFMQMLLNNQKIATKLVKTGKKPESTTVTSPVIKKKSVEKSRFQRKRS